MSPSPERSVAMLWAALLVPLLPLPPPPLLLRPLPLSLLLSLPPLVAGKLPRACLKGSSTLATISRACRSDDASRGPLPGPDCWGDEE